MNMEELMDRIEELMESATGLAFTNKLLIDGAALKQCLEDMRLNVPEEIRQARAIAAARADILEKAKEDAQRLIAKTEERAVSLVATDAITQTAQKQANDLLTQARAEAEETLREARAKARGELEQAHTSAEETLGQAQRWSTDLRTAASDFVEDIIRKTDEVLSANLSDLRQVQKGMRAAAKSNSN